MQTLRSQGFGLGARSQLFSAGPSLLARPGEPRTFRSQGFGLSECSLRFSANAGLLSLPFESRNLRSQALGLSALVVTLCWHGPAKLAWGGADLAIAGFGLRSRLLIFCWRDWLLSRTPCDRKVLGSARARLLSAGAGLPN